MAEHTTASAALAALEARLRQDLDWLCLPPKSWVHPRTVDGVPALDVLIVGAGMCGLAAAAALKFVGVAGMRIVDQASAGREGPWVTFARMQTLRSPKILTGPALGQPALTFRAWYEAQFGVAQWEALDKIPRTMWMDYLRWYRRVLDLPVENDTRMSAVRARSDGLVAVDLVTASGLETVLVRHLVLANGRDGFGGPAVPAFIAALPREQWAHTSEDIDFDALRGKRITVIGLGASALDNAAVALETGAARVDLFARRSTLPRINKLTGISGPGLEHGFASLPDDWKWRFLAYSISSGPPAPRSSVLRVSRHPNAFFHLGSPIGAIDEAEGALAVTTPKGRYVTDFVIAGTGFRHALTMRAEFAEFAPHVRLWSERFTPSEDAAFDELSTSPDLGPAFELQEKTPGACPSLRNIHCFNYASSMSHGKLSSDIPGVSIGAQRLAQGVASRLFVEDAAAYYEDLQNFAVAELFGDEWKDADT